VSGGLDRPRQSPRSFHARPETTLHLPTHPADCLDLTATSRNRQNREWKWTDRILSTTCSRLWRGRPLDQRRAEAPTRGGGRLPGTAARPS
jgi:hypothetical protein